MDEIQLTKIKELCKHNDSSFIDGNLFKMIFISCFPDKKNINLNFCRIDFDFLLDICYTFIFEIYSWENISFNSILDVDCELSMLQDFVFMTPICTSNFIVSSCFFDGDFYASNKIYHEYKAEEYQMWLIEREREDLKREMWPEIYKKSLNKKSKFRRNESVDPNKY